MNLCVICKEPLDNGQDIVVLREKGSIGVNKASEQRGDTLVVSAGQSVHKQCRFDYCNKNTIKRDLRKSSETPSTSRRSLRSSEPNFQFREHCLFCGQPAKFSGKKRGCDVFPVRTSDFQSTIVDVCRKRADSWAETVHSRIEFAQDLHAADAIYHQMCSTNFRTGKQIPRAFQLSSQDMQQTPGRPIDVSREKAFLKVVDYLQENDDEQISISDLVQKMNEYCDKDAYSDKYMKAKLEEHFGNDIVITTVNNKANVVTLKGTASNILYEFYETPKLSDVEEEKLRLVRAAADLIKSDIKSSEPYADRYPSCEDLSSLDKNSEFVPESLRLFLRIIFSEKRAERRIASIGQAIMQAARPRVLVAPLQIGLAVQMHHHFGSKFLIDSLYNLGFSSSYSEVQRFERSAARSQGTDIPGITSAHSIQFVADNADHNIATLDGRGTFHGMGIIATVMPKTTITRQVPRLSATLDDVTAVGKIKIHYYKSSTNDNPPLLYNTLQCLSYVDPTCKLDLLWKVVWPIRVQRPGWSGMMQAVSRGSHPGQSSIIFLPMIDMNPSDMSCIYSTLMFVSAEASRQNVQPVLTFDQPLWWKAQIIVASERTNSDLRSIVLRLGAFHTQMSFLGCIGNIMSGSGLAEVLEVGYAPNAVGHMLSGKAVARAVRGHFLVDAALNALLTSQAFEAPLPEVGNDDEEDTVESIDTQVESSSAERSPTPTILLVQPDHIPDDLQDAVHLFDKLMASELNSVDVCSEDVLERIQQKLGNQRHVLANNPTAQLWLQYMAMVDLLRKFIKAERTGNWSLHLQCLQEMLPYFVAAGHNLYTKSVYIHLQQMLQLQTQHPDVFALFNTGYHVIRRSDRYWGGLSSDLIIEQVLMRSMKSTGGLTRGRGMSEAQRTQWLLSMPACADINGAMQEVTGTMYATSEQHKDATDARQRRDESDTQALLAFLQARNPFHTATSLRNIVTGVTAADTVNAHKATEVGSKILETMKGKNVFEYTFKKKNHAVTLDHKVSAKVDGESIHVDSQLLFQRLITAAKDMTDNVADIFHYELCSIPSALFETNGLLREANKPSLADAVWTLAQGVNMPTQEETDMCYVLDGGSLLQRLPWSRDTTFGSICQLYVAYVQRWYADAIVVFDGYEAGPSTKDMSHRRRSRGVVGAEVNFVEGMPMKTKKEHFLANSSNKQRFILMLSQKLQENGIRTVHADGDADLLIVQTAVECASRHPTTLIGEDTDLLVLLCMHADTTSFPLLFKSGGQQTSKKMMRIWNINWLKKELGPETCSLLPFVHAITGCDTTSRLFGVGKGAALRKLRSNVELKKEAAVFLKQASKEEVISAGEKVLTCLYGGDYGEGLDVLRYRKFCEKAMRGCSFVQVHTLPPTAAAAQYHSARTYFQCQEWLGNTLNPEEWGWIENRASFEPKTTDWPPAPEPLLQVIRCNCQVNCDTRRCSCRKHGLECSVACGYCRGVGCTNAMSSVDTLFEDDNTEFE